MKLLNKDVRDKLLRNGRPRDLNRPVLVSINRGALYFAEIGKATRVEGQTVRSELTRAAEILH